MRNLFSNKPVICGLLAVLILIPLGMIGGLVQERQMRQQEVEREIARSGTGAQTLAGPVLVLPCTETYLEWTAATPASPRTSTQRTRRCTQVVLPATLEINGEVVTDTRRRGIYEVLVDTASLQASGQFEWPAAPVAEHVGGELRFGPPYLSIGIADPRGIAAPPALSVDGQALVFEPGASLSLLGPGIHAPLTARPVPGAALSYSIGMRLNGMQEIDFLPLGRQTDVRLSSAWPHPSFTGAYLPAAREVDDDGFRAHWSSSFLATNIAEQFERGLANDETRGDLFANRFGVDFIPAVDVYLKSERATKYGILFVGICFITLLLTEVLKQLRIHPLQYLMVAVALSIFFLLVLALSEHLGFLTAYVIASVACVGLLGFYLAHCVHDRRLAAGFSAVLGVLYALLYGLLSAEDYALLMGSLLVFGIAAATMVLTRHIDWYALNAAGPHVTTTR